MESNAWGMLGLEYQFSISVDLVRGVLENRLGYVLSTNIASFVFFFVFVIKNAVIFSNHSNVLTR